MLIGIIGAGSVGLALARGFAAAGHDVVLGTRDAEKPAVVEWLANAGDHGMVADYRTAADSAQLVVMAVPGRYIVDVAEAIGPEAFAGKSVIDVTNPIVSTETGAVSAFGDDDSAAEALQRTAPGAHVVKAFNQMPAEAMTSPSPGETRPLRIAGDDAPSKAVVTELAESFGWTVRDLGPLKRARPLERGVVDWFARSQGG